MDGTTPNLLDEVRAVFNVELGPCQPYTDMLSWAVGREVRLDARVYVRTGPAGDCQLWMADPMTGPAPQAFFTIRAAPDIQVALAQLRSYICQSPEACPAGGPT